MKKLLLLALGAAVALAACSASGARALAQKACVKVDKAIALYEKAQQAPPATRDALMNQSLMLLRQALPEAAVAAGEDPTWQALQANLSETNRVPEYRLIPSLTSQCELIQSGGTP